jgi:hypothetical protein
VAAETGLLTAGLALELVALAMAEVSLVAKEHAHGNAIDAVNVYNDQVGFSTGSARGSDPGGAEDRAAGSQ